MHHRLTIAALFAALILSLLATACSPTATHRRTPVIKSEVLVTAEPRIIPVVHLTYLESKEQGYIVYDCVDAWTTHLGLKAGDVIEHNPKRIGLSPAVAGHNVVSVGWKIDTQQHKSWSKKTPDTYTMHRAELWVTVRVGGQVVFKAHENGAWSGDAPLGKIVALQRACVRSLSRR